MSRRSFMSISRRIYVNFLEFASIFVKIQQFSTIFFEDFDFFFQETSMSTKLRQSSWVYVNLCELSPFFMRSCQFLWDHINVYYIILNLIKCQILTSVLNKLYQFSKISFNKFKITLRFMKWQFFWGHINSIVNFRLSIFISYVNLCELTTFFVSLCQSLWNHINFFVIMSIFTRLSRQLSLDHVNFCEIASVFTMSCRSSCIYLNFH